MIKLDQKKSRVTELVLKLRRITDHSISKISSHSRRFWPDSLLSAYIQVEESYLSCVLNTAYIGLFDRSLLRMSFNQLELALKKNTTSKLRTPVSMHQFDPV